MDAEKYVSVDTISQFKMVKQLTTDRDLLVQIMQRSKLLELSADQSKVRPISKAERTTIILRDIASDTPLEELRALFESDECAPVLNLRSDIGDTWFVTFEDEDSCLKAALYLRQQKFQGKAIRLCVKSENLTRSFYQQPPAGWNGATGPGAHNNGYFNPAGNGAAPQRRMRPGYGAPMMRGPRPGGHFNGPSRGMPFWDQDGVPMYTGQQPAPGMATGGEFGKHDRRGQRSDGRRKMNGGRKGGNNRQGGRKKRFTNGGRRTDGSQQQNSAANSAAADLANLQLGPEHFPALPSVQKAGGYKTPFTSYSREEMSAIVKRYMPQNAMPASMQDKQATSVVRNQPQADTQLLKPFPV